MGGAPKWSKLALLVLKPLVTWGSTVVGKPHVWRMSEHGLWAWGNIYIHRNEITLCDIEVYELYKYHVHYECIILHMFVCTHIYHISWMYSISCCVQSAFESIYEFQHVHSHKMSVQGARYDVQYICLSLSYVLWQVCVSPVRALLNFATIHRHGQTEREREWGRERTHPTNVEMYRASPETVMISQTGTRNCTYMHTWVFFDPHKQGES